MNDPAARLLARIRAELGRGDGAATPGRPPSIEACRRVAADESCVAVFMEQGKRAGLMVREAGTADVAERVAEEIAAVSAKRVVVAGDAVTGPVLEEAAKRAGAVVVRRASVDDTFGADAALTDVAGAVAETGSLVYRSSATHGRSEPFVPGSHVVLVPASRIVADLLDMDLGPSSDGSAVHVISGPSKTADIEGILVTGVHGPGVVRVVVWKDDAAGAD